ncbi:hypothetical protein QNM97_22360 [Gordonia sp. L191]|uniref:hypothetical protein n=1 Tax=Gordonia sp. L191 TaxID=2982699 RepID=UPI0024BF57A5|nr:hypothetical protein [Gordonia sp. L191]WHU46687.1 hypothetical protein QNM97_22360 [Gordonia sp. L191]
MAAIRCLWCVLAVGALAFEIWAAFQPVGFVSMGCGKGNVLEETGTRPGATCEDSTFSALGPWPLIQLGLALAVPPIVAAIVMRRWVSWLVVPVMLVVSFVGLAHWTFFWLLLTLAGVPMAVLAIIIAGVHLGVKALQDSQRSRADTTGSLGQVLRRA